MRILIFNWRDVKNPKSGGAEILTHEIAKRWVKKGNSVTLLCESFGGKNEEIVNGIQIIRKGKADFRARELPVHVAAYLWYKKQQRNFDFVIDEIHGIPFFTPLYVKQKKIALLCEVANEIWDIVFPFPMSTIGKTIERKYFRLYRHTRFLTISQSTKNDLIAAGITEKNITILPMGISVPKMKINYTKEINPTLIFVGRLSKTKGIEDVLKAFEITSRKLPLAKLWIIGRGEVSYEKALRRLARELKIEKSINFFGFVSEKEKFTLMAKAHILIAASSKEGWGLIVPEAGFCRTPSVVYNTAGLKDVVKNNKTGIIVEKSPVDVSEGIRTLLENTKLYKKVQNGAFEFAKSQNWDNTANTALRVMQEEK